MSAHRKRCEEERHDVERSDSQPAPTKVGPRPAGRCRSDRLLGAGAAWASHRAAASGHGLGAAAVRLHAEFVVDRALRRAEASEEQRQQIEAILDRAFETHRSLRPERRAMHEEAAAVLTADSVDRARLEALRVRHMQIIEKGPGRSRRRSAMPPTC